MIRHITDEGLEDLLVRERALFAVAFMTYDSVPCDRFREEFGDLPELLRGRVKFYQIDEDENPTMADDLKILAVPTMLVFRDGQELARYEGVYTKECLKERFETLLLIKKPGGKA